jgi:redox-sensitive bicupin YhaK (pirin superfamily)
MSGPVRAEDAPEDAGVPGAAGARDRGAVEISESRDAQVGAQRVRRALPRRTRRTVGAWCFVDHIGPARVTGPADVGIGPHPHIGLQTVTWMLAGELRHRDSIGSDQVIRPGELNLMTAGVGVAHAEDPTGRRGTFHGVQLWVAQPERTRHGPPAFEHHAELPRAELDRGEATVLVGGFAGAASTARRDTEHLGVDLDLAPGASVLPLDAASEHAVVVLEGWVALDGHDLDHHDLAPGRLAYLGPGHDEVRLTAGSGARALLLGGLPFETRPLMWWNFVARTHEEVTAAQQDWNRHAGRFGEVESMLDWIPAPPVPWA